jgi:hypothetical protein
MKVFLSKIPEGIIVRARSEDGAELYEVVSPGGFFSNLSYKMLRKNKSGVIEIEK